MAEIKKIHRAVEMPPVKRAAFVNLIKTCNGATTKEGSIYMSKESTLLDRDIEREMRKCSQLDSGLTNAIMLLYGRPDLGNIDYGSLDISKPKDQGIIMELHSVLNEDKLSEAISLAEEIINTEDIPGVKGVLSNGIESIKKHLQAFRPVWQEYQDYAAPLIGKDKRLPRSEIESAFVSDQNRIANLEEEIGRKTQDLEGLKNRVAELRQRNEERAELLGKTIGETKQKVEEVVGGKLLHLPQKPGRPAAAAEGIDISPAGEQLVADIVTGVDVTGETKGKVIPIKRGTAKKEIPDDIA